MLNSLLGAIQVEESPPTAPQPLASTSTSQAHPMSVLAARRRTKAEVCEAYLAKLGARGVDVQAPGLAESIRAHFYSMPTRYALDVNIDSLDVLSHLKLVQGGAAVPPHAVHEPHAALHACAEARADPSSVAFAVRPVEVVITRHRAEGAESPLGTSAQQQQARGGPAQC